MKTFTFDWNCVISVENDDEQAESIRQLVHLHRAGSVSVGITTVSASESLSGSKAFPGSAKQFNFRLRALGWDDLDIVLGPAVWGMTFIDRCKIAGDNFESERDKIWQTLFPNVRQKLPEGVSETELRSSEFKKWRNAWCDVHTVWTHIDSRREVFVTNNTKNFQRHFENLRSLGLKSVLTPQEAIEGIV